MFIDTHCHFDFPPFSDDYVESLQLAEKAAISDIIIPAVSIQNIDRIWHLIHQHTQLHGAIGFHPLYLSQFEFTHLDILSQRLSENSRKCVAIGEIGLDLFMDDPLFELQKQVLVAQLKLAKQHDLPVILHSRRSHDQLAAILRRHSVPARGVIHGFAGSLSQAEAFIQLGYFIGVGGTITYPRAQKTRQAIAQLPLSSLLFETDAPDMPVYGFQGQLNRPERIQYIYQALCELREEPAEEISHQIYLNSQLLFNLR